MDIVNQMIEEDKNAATTTQNNLNPNDIISDMAIDAEANEKKPSSEKTSDQIKQEEDAAKLAVSEKEAKDREALKEKEKAEKKEIQLDDKGQPQLDELGDKVPKDASPVEKQWYETEEAPTGTPKSKNTDEDKQKEITDKLNRLAELEKTFADPELEAFAAAKKQGKSIKEFYNEVVGTDYDNLTPEALQELKLKSLGVEGDDLVEALEAFSSLPKWDKVERTSALKTELKSKQSDSLKRFSIDAKAQEKSRQENIQKQVQEADAFAKSLIGKKMYGIEITPSIANDYKNAVVSGVKDFINEDGTINHSNYSTAYIFYKNKEAIVYANVKSALNKGKGEILADVTRASKNETVNRVPDEKGTAKTDFERASDDFYNQYAKK